MIKQKEKAVLPKLRFLEFRDAGPWEVKRLGDICAFLKGKGLPKSAITPEGNQPCIHYGELFTDYGEVISSVKSFTNRSSNYILSEEDDVLMPTSDVTPNGLAKASCLKQSNVVLGGDILVIRLNKDLAFGEYLSRFIRFREQEVLRYVSGTTVFHLYPNSISRLRVSLPSLPEQQKIADCLSSLDDLIRAEAARLEALKEHKKGLMQRLFPREGQTTPDLRFPEFHDAGPWEVKRLGEVCDFLKGKGLPKTEITPAGSVPCIHYGELFTDYGEVIKSVKSFTNGGNNYVLSEEDDVLMPTSDVTPNGLAKASCLKQSNIVLGGDILIIRLNKELVFGEYLSRLIRFREQEILRYVSGTTVFHLYPDSISKLRVPLPCLPEQQKIADCLSSLDELIRAQDEKIEVLKKHKKGLVQQLFPSLDEVRE